MVSIAEESWAGWLKAGVERTGEDLILREGERGSNVESG
jgi:hypothetical protein